MRWYWIDHFIEFVSGTHAVAVKNVSLSEPHLHGYFPGVPQMPSSLIVEGLAQTGGLLVGEMTDFHARLVLAKIAKAQFFCPARPGDQLTYTAKIDNVGPEGARISATSHLGEQLQASVEYFLAALTSQAAERMFDPADFARLLRVLRVYDVAVTPDGRRLEIPDEYLKAERARTDAGGVPLGGGV